MLNGIASAAASDTDPRIPAQPMTIRSCQRERRARWDSRRSSARMANGVVSTQSSRTPITAAATRALQPSS